MALSQSNKTQIQRQSILRIQSKLDCLIENYQLYQTQIISDKKYNKLKTRSSNDNNKRNSIPYKTNESSIPYRTNDSNRIKQIQQRNSSQQLSRYLDPQSSQQHKPIIQQRNNYNNSRGSVNIGSNKTKRIKPFIVNSDIHIQSSINQLYPNNTIEFQDDQTNKENINYSNINYHKEQKHPMKKKQNCNTQYKTDKNNKNSTQKISRHKNSSQKYHQKSIKQVKNKIQQLRKLPQVNHNNKNPCQHEGQNNKLRQRAKSQNTTNRKIIKQGNKKKQTYYEVSVTAPQAEYEHSERNQPSNNYQIYEPSILQTSAIFKAVQFPQKFNQSSAQIRQSQSSELSRQAKKSVLNNHNKTLLESIQQKKKMIDRQLSKRLMKNSSILYGGSTNLLIAKDNY